MGKTTESAATSGLNTVLHLTVSLNLNNQPKSTIY